MRHALMYHGGYEKNAPALKPGATTFIGSDGTEHALPQWPPDVDGLRVGYMEKPGKHFAAVRVQSGKSDIVLNHSVLLDPSRHLGYGNRFSAEPTVIEDEIAHVLLDDIVARNPEQAVQLESLRHRVPRSEKKKKSDS